MNLFFFFWFLFLISVSQTEELVLSSLFYLIWYESFSACGTDSSWNIVNESNWGWLECLHKDQTDSRKLGSKAPPLYFHQSIEIKFAWWNCLSNASDIELENWALPLLSDRYWVLGGQGRWEKSNPSSSIVGIGDQAVKAFTLMPHKTWFVTKFLEDNFSKA